MTPPRHPCTSERSRRRVVLLVEDEPFVREATCHILQSAGFDVLPAADAQEAMRVYENNGRKIDLLMTDMALPGRNGRQLAHDRADPPPRTRANSEPNSVVETRLAAAPPVRGIADRGGDGASPVSTHELLRRKHQRAFIIRLSRRSSHET